MGFNACFSLFFIMAGNLRVFTLNTGMSENLAGLLNFINNQNLDIIFLQEIRMTREEILSKMGHLGYYVEVNINEDDLSKPGTAIVWRSSIPIYDFGVLVQNRCQFAFLGPFLLMNVYAPSGSDKTQERNSLFGVDMFQFMSLHSTSLVICGGDFNSILSAIDVENGFGFRQKFSHHLSELVRVYNLTDAFRHLNPTTLDFTFFRANASPSRLDRFYLSSSLLDSVACVEHLPSLSDHCGVLLSVKIENFLKPFDKQAPRKGHSVYWKLNSAILYEEEFRDNFADFWLHLVTFKSNFNDVANWWDNLVKPSVKDFCILYSKRRAARRKDTLKFWFAYLKVCLKDRNWLEVSRTKLIIKKFMSAGASGYQIRSRSKDVATDEEASLFNANQEMRNAKLNCLDKLKINDTIVDNQERIEAEVLRFINF